MKRAAIALALLGAPPVLSAEWPPCPAYIDMLQELARARACKESDGRDDTACRMFVKACAKGADYKVAADHKLPVCAPGRSEWGPTTTMKPEWTREAKQLEKECLRKGVMALGPLLAAQNGLAELARPTWELHMPEPGASVFKECMKNFYDRMERNRTNFGTLDDLYQVKECFNTALECQSGSSSCDTIQGTPLKP